MSETRHRAIRSSSDDEEVTSPTNEGVVMYRELLIVLDQMTPPERMQFLTLANAFVAIGPAEKQLMVIAAERMARL